jgi:hypothetical protein
VICALLVRHRILVGAARTRLAELPEKSVHVCMTCLDNTMNVR